MDVNGWIFIPLVGEKTAPRDRVDNIHFLAFEPILKDCIESRSIAVEVMEKTGKIRFC